jgi:hypothetical protein
LKIRKNYLKTLRSKPVEFDGVKKGGIQMYIIYLDGHEWCTRSTEKEAQAVVASYDGEKDCYWEFEEFEGEEE